MTAPITRRIAVFSTIATLLCAGALAFSQTASASSIWPSYQANSLSCNTYFDTMQAQYTFSAANLYYNTFETQLVWVRTNLQKYVGSRWQLVESYPSWVRGMGVDSYNAPQQWIQDGQTLQNAYRQSWLPSRIVALYGHGYYTLSVDFSWATSNYGAPAGSGVSWTTNFCTL